MEIILQTLMLLGLLIVYIVIKSAAGYNDSR